MHRRKNGLSIEINLVEVNVPLVELIYRYYTVLNYQIHYVKEPRQRKQKNPGMRSFHWGLQLLTR